MNILESLLSQFRKSEKKRGLSSPEKVQSGMNYKSFYYGVEDVLCFERAMRFCYASLEMLIHNRTIRQQCQGFFRWSLNNEEEMEKMLEESLGDMKIERKYEAYTLPADDLNAESILSLGLVVAGQRLSIYEELREYLSVKNRIQLNHIIAHVIQEIKFFEREKEIISVEGILYSLN